jgi:hypothetical protein
LQNGIHPCHEDGLDVIHDYFVDRDVSDSDNNEDDTSANTSDVLMDGSHTDGPLLIPDVIVTEPKMPEMKNLLQNL